MKDTAEDLGGRTRDLACANGQVPGRTEAVNS